MAHGLTRTVFLTANYAIKVPSLRRHGYGLTGVLWSLARGILANQGEASWWSWARHTGDRDKFCPVLASHLGGLVNIYRRCQPYRVSPEIENAMHERTFRPLAITPQPGDCKPDNYGWLDEGGKQRLVVLDYDMSYNGCPHDYSGAVNRMWQDAQDEQD